MQYIKLCASIIEKKVFDMPDHTIDRYIRKKTKSKLDIWRFMMPCEFVRKGNIVRIETNTAAMVHWSTDNWVTMQDSDSVETGFGLYYTDIPSKLLKGEKLDFTFYWPESGNWENKNYTITILN
jgi:glucoamylase